MIQTPSKLITQDEFLQQPETKPASEYFAADLRLTVGEIFSWLLE